MDAPAKPTRDATELLGSKQPNNEIRARKQEKQKASRRLILTRVATAVLAVVALAAVVWMLFFSSIFALRENALKVTSSQEGLDLTSAQSLAQEEVGTPLPRIGTGGLREAILQDPHYLDAKISRRWPNGLDVVVEPRIPILAWEQSAGKYQMIGADGIAIDSQGEPAAGATVVKLSGEKTLSERGVNEIKTVLDSLDASLGDQLQFVSYNAGLITLNLGSGAQVVWGSSEDSSVKNQVVTVLMNNRGAAVYDVTDPTRPSIR